MADLTSFRWRKGRARDKTWELARVYRHKKAPKKFAMPNVEGDSTQQRAKRDGSDGEEEEEEVGNIDGYEERNQAGSEEESEEESEGEDQDARGVKSGSAAPSDDGHHYASGFAPQFRLRDGRMVLDEDTMQIERHQSSAMLNRVAEVEEDDHKFINSGTKIKGRRDDTEIASRKTTKWTAEETARFLDVSRASGRGRGP